MVKEQPKCLLNKVLCKSAFFRKIQKKGPILNEFQLENSFKIGPFLR